MLQTLKQSFLTISISFILSRNQEDIKQNLKKIYPYHFKGFAINRLLRGIEITNLPFTVIVMPECFYRASSKNFGFPLNSIAGMTAR